MVGDLVGKEGGDDLGVGGDAFGENHTAGSQQLAVVVDIAVEGRRHERHLGAIRLAGIQRVGVGLTDGADTRPSGVAQHEGLRTFAGESGLQQIVGRDRGPQRRRVVTQLADLGGGLVDERQLPAVGLTNRPGLVERIPGARGEGIPDRRRVRHQHLDAGGVASADLEAVERCQALLNREIPGERPARLVGRHRSGHGQSITGDRPDGVLQPQQLHVDCLAGCDRLYRGDSGAELRTDLCEVGSGVATDECLHATFPT